MSLVRNVIVQAGGLGSRLGKFTYNRPKCLVSVNGVNFLQSIKVGFPEAKLHIIGDYKYGVLEAYLQNTELELNYTLTKASGSGTTSGIGKALAFVPDDEPFAITWSDLYFTEPISFPKEDENFIVLTNRNKCRYRYQGGKYVKINTFVNGIIGLFLFKNKMQIENIPEDGEFVQYLNRSNIKMNPFIDNSINELGTVAKLKNFMRKNPNSRFFNRLEIEDKTVIKKPRDERFIERITDEVEWYRYMIAHKYSGIPKIKNFAPLTMERVIGIHPFQIKDIRMKEEIVVRIIDRLEDIHKLGKTEANLKSLYDTYTNKTLERIIPVVNILKINGKDVIKLNGKNLKPLLPCDREVIERIFGRLSNLTYFTPIHGDPTFSNILITEDNEIKFIDPRGYFGNTKIFGDPRYDYAKLYYSAIGNYDQFNMQNYVLKIDSNDISLKLHSSGYNRTEIIFKEKLKSGFKDIEILHSLIWLSLSGYLINDYDGMIASYLYGLKLLNELGELYDFL
jgi:thiamine kinase-like enzyme/GTP:adenosylcobinamide-phosphate guanylyltransferase